MRQSLSIILIILTCFTSCKKDNTANPSTGKINVPGFGASTAAFSGANWQLPAGVILKDSIREASWWTDVHGGLPVAIGNYHGTPGGIFTVCLYLQNTTGQSITIQFPQEILLLSNTIQTQNGVIILPRTITIPAHQEIVMIAGAFCLNLGRSTPDLHTNSGALQAFSFGPATVPAQLREISDILKSKNITYSSLVQPNGMLDPVKMAKMSIIQSAVWEITDEDGLKPETRTALQNL
jgi:hypothetical protein